MLGIERATQKSTHNSWLRKSLTGQPAPVAVVIISTGPELATAVGVISQSECD